MWCGSTGGGGGGSAARTSSPMRSYCSVPSPYCRSPAFRYPHSTVPPVTGHLSMCICHWLVALPLRHGPDLGAQDTAFMQLVKRCIFAGNHVLSDIQKPLVLWHSSLLDNLRRCKLELPEKNHGTIIRGAPLSVPTLFDICRGLDGPPGGGPLRALAARLPLHIVRVQVSAVPLVNQLYRAAHLWTPATHWILCHLHHLLQAPISMTETLQVCKTLKPQA